TGLPLTATHNPPGWQYGPGMFGPAPELRRLDAIRPSLRNPACDGPDPVYAIVMDVGREEHRADLVQRHLLFGAVAYAAGRLGDEPVRSQGHVHQKSPRNGWSTPELYEIWQGRACILMQESDGDDPGRCFAITAGPGEVVLVPPGWAHATISADPRQPLVFGAWCDRAYGFVYDGVRAHGGLAHFPILTPGGELAWTPNPRYRAAAGRPLVCRGPRLYPEFGLESGVPIYRQYENDPARFDWVPDPGTDTKAALWENFSP
ncbi:MAG: glucose-6-phosphate isomerase, partial [Opitutaceae bacterium]|nr:glucose-6-phosphate isomerase [Opitutaceae bacterium]